jgi:hypothetical protein
VLVLIRPMNELAPLYKRTLRVVRLKREFMHRQKFIAVQRDNLYLQLIFGD